MKKRMHEGENYLNNFLKKRFIKVWIPYMMAQWLYMIVDVLFLHNIEVQGTFDILLHIIGIKLSNTSLWFIIEVFIFYITFYIKEKYLNSFPGLIFWTIAYLLFLYYVHYFSMGTYTYQATHCLIFGLLFALYEKNILVWKTKIDIILKKNVYLFVLMYVIFITLTYIIYLKGMRGENIGALSYVKILVTMITCITFILFVTYMTECLYSRKADKYKFKNNSIFTFLSKVSLEIYLYHMIYIKLFHIENGKTFVAILWIVILTLITAQVMHLFNMKIQKILLRRFKSGD